MAPVTDPRDPQKILYPLASLAFAGVLMFLFRLNARRQIGLLLRNGPSIRKFQALFGVERFPHGDTLEAAFSNLETDQIQTVVTGMTETLIRKKVLYSYRLFGIYFIVA
ncbi:MAG: transposase family protein, partial [Deltaproteobacteria bacterium]|nr:transposase family protein [Deltaproteobacteria bacterium]